jgi:hypothetical protein
VRDPRYSTAAWQKLRKAVLARDCGICQIQGPRCRGYATSVHHLVPSSQAPELFWEPSNLAAACGRCNYGDGARIAAENTRTTIAKLRALVWEQQAEIASSRPIRAVSSSLIFRPLWKNSPMAAPPPAPPRTPPARERPPVDRRDHAEGDADAHPSFAGALAELLLLDLAVVVLDEHRPRSPRRALPRLRGPRPTP